MAWVAEYKTTHPCVDCGRYDDSYLMDFDHLGDKVMNISALAKWRSMRRVQAEMAKCELVCCRCHRIRTHLRANA